MFITDITSFMLKAGRILKAGFPNVLHGTYLLHTFQLVTNTLRNHYSRADGLITSTKNVIKCPKRTCELKIIRPGIPV